MNDDLFGRPSTVDTGIRQENDYYETPAWMVASLLRHHPIGSDRGHARCFIVEPCAGDGAISRIFVKRGYRVLTNDIDQRHPTMLHLDARHELWTDPATAETDWVISNTSFDIAFKVLEQAYMIARMGVALLLRKTFDEPTKKRGAWLSRYPPTHTIRLPRHKFRRQAKGSDSTSVDWFIWRKGDQPEIWTIAPPYTIDHRAKELGLS